MKAITLWQPWASLMALNFKKVETRSWPTQYRGPLAIHSAANVCKNFATVFEQQQAAFQMELGSVLNVEFGGIIGGAPACKQIAAAVAQLPRGQVLCIVELKDVRKADEVRDSLSLREQRFGHYAAGRYAWITELLEVLKQPVAAKGRQGLWNWER